MLPTVKDGQLAVFIKKRTYKPGDIVIAHQNGREVVKRISKIEKRYVWLHGDNATESTDSRQLGPIQSSRLQAKLLLHL